MASFLPEMEDPPTGARAAFRASTSSLKKSLTNFKFGSNPDILDVAKRDRSKSPGATSPPIPYFEKYPRSNSSRGDSRSTSRMSDSRALTDDRSSRLSAKAAGKQRETLTSPEIRSDGAFGNSTTRRKDRTRAPATPSAHSTDRSIPERTSISAPSSPAHRGTKGSDYDSWGNRLHSQLSPPSHRSGTRSSMSPLHRSEFSDSSAETIPATPTSSLPAPVLVAAPFPASIEAMDALVDQLNGDTGVRPEPASYVPSAKRKSDKDRYNRYLYAPPLPKPPEGITLGIRARAISEDSIDAQKELEPPKRERTEKEKEKEMQKERKQRKERERRERIMERDRLVAKDKERERERRRREKERLAEEEEALRTSASKASIKASTKREEPVKERDHAEVKHHRYSRSKASRREMDVDAEEKAPRPKATTTRAAADDPQEFFDPATVRPRARHDAFPSDLGKAKERREHHSSRSVAKVEFPTKVDRPSVPASPPVPSPVAVPPSPRAPVRMEPSTEGLPRSKPTNNLYSLAVPEPTLNGNPSLEAIIRNYVSTGASPASPLRPLPPPPEAEESRPAPKEGRPARATRPPAIQTGLEVFPTMSSPASPLDSTPTPTKTLPPTISEIIRAHAPALNRQMSYGSSRTSTTPVKSSFPLPTQKEESNEDEEHGRSSVDSITEEVRQSIHTGLSSKAVYHSKSFPTKGPEVSPVFRQGRMNGDVSLPNIGALVKGPVTESYSPSIDSNIPAGTSFLHLPSAKAASETLAIAQHLRSPRLTRLLTLKRSPHRGLTVSLADVGSSTGHPVFVFLGLGCVRYIVGLYDEMAEALGLRLVCVDRWGLGKTDDVPGEKRGLLEWAAIMEEVADTLEIVEFSILAHSAGTPYSMATCLRLPRRIVGSVHLLAPWVSTAVEGGYKWLKYVPNGLLKTAQAAEWKVQGWMLGKPPTIRYQGIGYNAETGSPIGAEGPRPSFQFSDYDDLADFDGRFGSATSLPGASGGHSSKTGPPPTKAPEEKLAVKKKTSKGIMGIFGSKGTPSKSTKSASSPPSSGSRKEGMRSFMGRRTSNAAQSVMSTTSTLPPLNLPTIEPDSVGLGIRFDAIDELGMRTSPLPQRLTEGPPTSTFPRGGRRSISLTSRSSSRAGLSMSLPPPPRPGQLSQRASTIPAVSSPKASGKGITLADALMRASHAESLKGGTADLLAILERDSKPWGFSYTDVRHPVLVWYGDKDEKISINSVRWMERAMTDCKVKVVPGAGHSLLTNSKVVVEVLESIARQCVQGSF